MARTKSDGRTSDSSTANLALRGVEANFGPEHADTFRRDLHPDLRANGIGRTLSRRAHPATSIPR